MLDGECGIPCNGVLFPFVLFDLPNSVLRWSSILFVMSVDEVFVNGLDVAVCFGAKRCRVLLLLEVNISVCFCLTYLIVYSDGLLFCL